MSNVPYYLDSIRAGLRRGVTVPVRNEAIRCVRELEDFLCRETDTAPDAECDPVNGQLVSASVGHTQYDYEHALGRLKILSRIVRRALASRQLEKLEDAVPYLDPEKP